MSSEPPMAALGDNVLAPNRTVNKTGPLRAAEKTGTDGDSRRKPLKKALGGTVAWLPGPSILLEST